MLSKASDTRFLKSTLVFHGFLLLLHVFARFVSSFLQDGEADKKYFVVMDTNFFIYNVLGGESFCTLFEFFI